MSVTFVRVAKCIGCGCTDTQACEPFGCHWLVVDRGAGRGVCSSCPSEIRAFSPRRRGRSVPKFTAAELKGVAARLAKKRGAS
jgi:hypothetical protein